MSESCPSTKATPGILVTVLHYMLGGLEGAISSLWACSGPQMEELGRVEDRKTEVLVCVLPGRAK